MAGSPLLAILAGLANMPQQAQAAQNQRQDRAFAVQDEQAKQKQMAAEAESQQLQTAAFKQAQGQKYLQQVGQMATKNPKLWGDPAYVAKAIADGKQFGVDVPLIDGPNGTKTLDPKALSVKPNFQTDATFEDKMKLIAMPQAQRLQMAQETYDGVNPDDPFFKSDPYTPMSAGEKTAMANLPAKLESDLATDKIDEQGYINAVKSNYGLLKQAGVDPDALLTPEALRHQATKLTDAKIDNLHALGIHLKNEDKTRIAVLDEHMREFGIKTAIQQSQFSQRMNLEGQRISIAAANLGYRGQEMNILNQRLALAYRSASQSANNSTRAALTAAYRVAKDNYDRADRDYSALSGRIMAANAANPRYTPDNATINRLKDLKKQMDDAAPLLQTAGLAVTNAPSKAVTAVTGNRSQTVPQGGASGGGGGAVDYSRATKTATGPNGEKAYLIDGKWVIKK